MHPLLLLWFKCLLLFCFGSVQKKPMQLLTVLCVCVYCAHYQSLSAGYINIIFIDCLSFLSSVSIGDIWISYDLHINCSFHACVRIQMTNWLMFLSLASLHAVNTAVVTIMQWQTHFNAIAALVHDVFLGLFTWSRCVPPLKDGSVRDLFSGYGCMMTHHGKYKRLIQMYNPEEFEDQKFNSDV